MRFQLPLALLLTVPTVACTTDAPAPAEDDLDHVIDRIELENGGYDTADEAPMFADEALYAAADLEIDAAVADALATDPIVRDLETSATVERRSVIVMWGRMPAERVDTVRDWSGTLRLSRGAMVIRRRIAFEDAGDRVLPRTRRDEIQFMSRTSTHADGLALTILDPTPADAAPLILTYTSADGTITYTLDLGAVAVEPVIVDAGDGYEMVALGHRRRDACDHGFLRGRWRALSASAGHFAGLVLDSDGEPTGHIRGIYGQRRNGQAVFFGKLIARGGEFRGIARGTYGDGKFDGRWLVRTGDHGVIHGRYRAGDSLRAGHFLGRWAETSCADRPSDRPSDRP